jgi:hypothetical protein
MEHRYEAEKSCWMRVFLRRVLLFCLLGMFGFTDLAQPCHAGIQENTFQAAMQLPAESSPEPEWLDTVEDGDETMLDCHVPVLISGIDQRLSFSFRPCFVALPDLALDSPPPKV